MGWKLGPISRNFQSDLSSPVLSPMLSVIFSFDNSTVPSDYSMGSLCSCLTFPSHQSFFDRPSAPPYKKVPKAYESSACSAQPSSFSFYSPPIHVPVSPKRCTAHLTYGNRVLRGFSDFLPPPGPSFPFSHHGGGSLITKLYPTLCDPMDCSPPGSSVHGILQARILEWVVISFSRGSSQHRDQTWVSCIAGSLLHCRQMLYLLSHQGSPKSLPNTKVLPFFPC